GRTLRVKGNEIERCANRAGGVIGAAETMIEKLAQETAAGSTGDVWSTDARSRQRAPDGGGRVVVKLVEFLGCSTPVADVRFVPHFPVPGRDSVAAIAFDAMAGPLKNEFSPARIIFGRIGPATINLVILCSRMPLVLIRFGFGGQVFRHKADL